MDKIKSDECLISKARYWLQIVITLIQCGNERAPYHLSSYHWKVSQFSNITMSISRQLNSERSLFGSKLRLVRRDKTLTLLMEELEILFSKHNYLVVRANAATLWVTEWLWVTFINLSVFESFSVFIVVSIAGEVMLFSFDNLTYASGGLMFAELCFTVQQNDEMTIFHAVHDIEAKLQ